MSWQDREYVGDDGGSSYPFIQWIHRPHQVGQEAGGPFQPDTQAKLLGARIPGVAATLRASGGDIPGTYCRALRVAVLRTRSYWYTGRGQNERRLDDYEEGAHSKVQVACLVQDAEGNAVGPVTLTVKSTTASQFWAAYRAHRDAVGEATGGKAPPYAFWMTLQVGGVDQVQGSTVTLLERPDEPCDPDTAYVGDAALDRVDWDELRTWALAWSGNGNGDRPGIRPHARGTHRSQPGDPNAPASEGQRMRIHQLLSALGYEGRERQDEALRQRGFDPTQLTIAQASRLIERLQAAGGSA